MAINIYKFVTVYFAVLLRIQASKPSNKRLLSVWRLECDLGIVSDPECPIDGGWSSWRPWSPCTGECDDIGHRRRTRECINPPPSQEGAPCRGPEELVEACFIPNCTTDDFRKVIKGDFARTEALRQLEVAPALLDRCLQIECPYEAVETALANDNPWQLNSESFWNALQCVKHNLGCPVAGEWGVWGEWSACGARCGAGLKWRLRRCDTPPPSHSHLVCTGTPLQTEECIGDQCAMGHEARGSWGEWHSWSPCSTLCGPGVRRRRRVCLEVDTPRDAETWRTHCQGQHDDLKVCENSECYLDGGWSGWSGWGPCSKSCGAGKRSRTRSCTRPVPAQRGEPCVGPKVEMGACNLTPCETYTHTVAVLQSESYLHYNLINKRAALFHCYIRFLPLSAHGNLVRRETGENSYVRLSLQKWHVCLDACDSARVCCLPRSCSHVAVEPETWHNVLVTITRDGGILRLDDAPVDITTAWSCDPDLSDENMHVYVGEKLQGQIHEVMLNFMPLDIAVNRKRSVKLKDFIPTSVSNIGYEIADGTEAYLPIDNGYYMRIPCFQNQDEWQLQLTFRSKKEAGTILVLNDIHSSNFLLLELQNARIKLKLVLGPFKTESSSTTECLPDQWVDVTLTKERQKHVIEASINAGESLHVLFENELRRKRRESTRANVFTTDHKPLENMSKKSTIFPLCTDEFYVGGAPDELKKFNSEYFPPFSGVLASVKVNGELLDLHTYVMERQKEDTVHVSSRSASVSGSYYEVSWGKSGGLNLTCLHTREKRSTQTAGWLFLYASVSGTVKGKTVRSVDNGRVLRLIAAAHEDLGGFYTCRMHNNRRTRNIITYGVLGNIHNRLTSPDTTTAIALVTTLTLVLTTLVWLVIEGINDLRTGYGLFRDPHLTPEEEAESVCRYIDQNFDLVGSKSAAKLAKAKARRRGGQLAHSANFAAQEPQGMKEDLEIVSDDTSELPALPDLPEPGTSKIIGRATSSIYRSEQSYISPSSQGSASSPRARHTGSTSFDLVSPRVLCSRLMAAKRLNFSRQRLLSPNKHRRRMNFAKKLRTIEASSSAVQSPAHKILQKFSKLKHMD